MTICTKPTWRSLSNDKQCMDIWHPDMSSAKALENQTPTPNSEKGDAKSDPSDKKKLQQDALSPKTWPYPYATPLIQICSPIQARSPVKKTVFIAKTSVG